MSIFAMAKPPKPNDAAAAEAVEVVEPLAVPLTEEPLLLSTVASRFFSNYLCKLYHIYEGDLIMGLVFTEISLRNISRILRPLASQQGKNPEQWQAFLKRLEKEQIVPCNALSISEGTGIPRETVRRKVKKLEDMGWVAREDADKLVITRKPIELLRGFSLEVLQELLDSSREVQGLMDTIRRSQAA